MILLTGGAGYIGSHTAVQLLLDGRDVIILDNLSSSHHEIFNRIEIISGKEFTWEIGDVRDFSLLDSIFEKYPITQVIHFAGLKAVGESVTAPLTYYENNVFGVLQLLKAMVKHGVKTFVFSSSATVYGDPITLPLVEGMVNGIPTNPYGTTKLMIEYILADVVKADPDWRVVILRYFNPLGAHESGLIGEDPKSAPNNLMPLIIEAAIGKRKKLLIFGNDYDTPDGTGVRDFIHVVDLADGHLGALRKCVQNQGCHTYNLGTGAGFSVLELINVFQQVSGRTVPFEFVARRPGDVASCYADDSKARNDLNWYAKRGLSEMCGDSWRWQSLNPNGYVV